MRTENNMTNIAKWIYSEGTRLRFTQVLESDQGSFYEGDIIIVNKVLNDKVELLFEGGKKPYLYIYPDEYDRILKSVTVDE